MNEKIIELTRKLGFCHIQIARLQAERHIILEQIWAEKAKAFHTKRKVEKNEHTRLLHKAGTEKSKRKNK